VLATPASIAQARSEGPGRTRLQEPFAVIPMPHRAIPLHCPSRSVSLDGVSRYVPLSPLEIHDDLPVRFTIYGWSHYHQDNTVLDGIHELIYLGCRLYRPLLAFTAKGNLMCTHAHPANWKTSIHPFMPSVSSTTTHPPPLGLTL
jgi:hypothetical protein